MRQIGTLQNREQAHTFADYLLSIGVEKGETVIALLENRPEIMFIISAVAKIGAIVSCYTIIERIGHSSMKMKIEVWSLFPEKEKSTWNLTYILVFLLVLPACR